MAWWKSVRTDARKLWALPPPQRRLLAHGCGLVLLTAAALRLLGFRRWQATLARWSPPTRNPELGARNALRSAPETARLVRAAARRFAGADSCLPEALVLWALLRCHGVATELRIGVRKRGGRVQAHAWVEHAGRALGDAGAAAFVPFEQVIVPPGSRAA
jgi:hypothetical protein